MIFNFKKAISVLASAIMLSSTIGFAAAASYPAPFVDGGTGDGAVVYGDAAASSDIIAAIDVQQDLDALVTTTDSSSATATGDSVNLATNSRKIYYADAILSPRASLTSTELGEVLADGTFTDLSGTEYDFTQTINVGNAVSAFDTSGGDLEDPTIYLDVGTAPDTTVLYNYTLSFTKNLNVSDTVNVQGQRIKILGVDYVIGASSTNTTVYLYGAGTTVTITGGESQTVDVGGTEHTVELVSTSSATAGKIAVDGTSKSVTKGSKYAFPGGIVVYVKDITHPAFAGDLRNAELIIGANSLKLQDGQTVKEGADETSVKGTKVSLTDAGHGIISAMIMQVALPKSKTDHIAVGDSFTDPVFGGLSVSFAGVVPELDSTERGQVVYDTDNNQYAYLTFTSARAASAGEQKLAIVFDNATASTTVAPLLAHDATNSDGKGYIRVFEGQNARENDWIVINQGDAGTIIEVSDISVDTATSGSVTFEDVITGDSQKVTLTNSSGNTYTKSNVNFFGGNGYTVAALGNGTVVNITWSSASTTQTLFPRIKLKDGGWVALMQETTVKNATSVIFPDGLTSLATTGTAVDNGTRTYVTNGMWWQTKDSGTAHDVKVWGLNATTTTLCNFNVTLGPTVLFIEPKKWDDASHGDFICIPLTTTGTTEIALDDPVFNGTASSERTFSSNTYKSQWMNKYGTVVTKLDNTNENGIVTIDYPDSQMYLDVLFTAEGATITPGSGGGGGGQVLIVKDTEVNSVKDVNLFVVGGSCINTVAAKILGSDVPLCTSDFTDATSVGANQYIIKVVESPYNEDKIAMLVAGYESAETTMAVAKAKDSHSTDVGEAVYPEAA